MNLFNIRSVLNIFLKREVFHTILTRIINISLLGGEFESLVLNAPFFKKKVIIESYNVVETNENTARLVIGKASLG